MLDGVLRALEADHLACRSDPLVETEAVPAADRLEQVEELTAHELRAHRVEGLPTAGQLLGGKAAGGVELVAPREAEVAGEDRRALTETVRVACPAMLLVQRCHGSVCGRHTAAGVAAVHDVVVQQGGALEELHARGEPNERVGVITTRGAVAPVEKAGTQALATSQQPGHRVHERRDLGTDLGERCASPGDLPVDRLLDPAAQAVEVGGGLHEVLHGVGKSSSAYAGRPRGVGGPRAVDGCALSLAPWHTARRPRWRAQNASRVRSPR